MSQFLPAELAKTNKNFTSNTWYSNNWMLSQCVEKWWYRITIGSGGRGKTYSGRRLAVKGFLNKKRGFIWLRLTNQAVDNLIQNNGMGLIPIEMKNKYNITITTKGNAVYINGEHAGFVASIQGYYNQKGQEIQLPDYRLSTTLKNHQQEFSNFDIFADELIREESEKKTFDIKKAFQNQVENIVREKKGIRVFVYANFLTEVRDIEELFDIQLVSGKFGIYRNHKTKAVIEYLQDSKEWKARKKNTYAGVLNVSGGRFENKNLEDNRLIVYNHTLKNSKIIFNLKIRNSLFAVKKWKKYYVIAFYKGNENKKQTYSLRPEFMTTNEQNYNAAIREQLKTMFNNGLLKFTGYNTYQDYIKYM